MKNIVSLISIIILLTAASAAADPGLVILTDNSVITGDIVEISAGSVSIRKGEELIKIDSSKIERVVYDRFQKPKPEDVAPDANQVEKKHPNTSTEINEKPARPKIAPAANYPTDWPYKLSAVQSQQVARAGCEFSPTDRELALKLKERGFDARNYVDAWIKLAELSKLSEIEIRSEMIEKIAVMNYLEMGIIDIQSMFEYDYDVTEYYNWRIGGDRHYIAGWIFNGAAVSFFAASMFEYSRIMRCRVETASSNERNACIDSLRGNAEFLLIMAGLAAAIGTPLAVVGGLRLSRHAPDGELDDAGADGLRPYKIGPDQKDKEDFKIKGEVSGSSARREPEASFLPSGVRLDF